MLLEIKDFKGIATQVDKADLGLEFAFINQNYKLDVPGALVKVRGRGAKYNFSDLTFNDVFYWSPSNTDLSNTLIPPKWLGYDSKNSRLVMVDGNVATDPVPTPLVLGSAYTENIPDTFDFQDHGTAFRLAPNSLDHKPKILQHISRNFFEGDYNVDDFVFQDANPSYPTGAISLSVNEIEIGADTGLNLPQGTYRYKVAPVFDGVQEIPLPESSQSIGPGTDTKMGSITININKSVPTGTEPNKEYSLNPRITSLDIFRETNNTGTFYEIISIPINTKNSDTNKVADNKLIFRNNDDTTTYPLYAYSPTAANAYNAITASDGILSMPDINLQSIPQGNGANGVYYRWVLNFFIDDGYEGAYETQNSPTFYQTPNVARNVDSDGNATGAGMEYRFADVDGPLDNNSWKFLLSKGIITIADSNNGFVPSNGQTRMDDPSLNFKIRARLVRRLYYLNNQGTSVLYTQANQNIEFYELGAVAFTKDMIIVQMDNDKIGSNLAGGILKSGDVVTNIIGNLGGALRVNVDDDTNTIESGHFADIHKDYLITPTNEQVNILVNDTGFSNGRVQPFPDKLLVDTRYKYSQMIGSRLFVGNVRIDPENNSEDHPDWIVYSESGMPDILPAVNFIQIKDQQGGVITGLNKILDSLVVFMSRGVFRLDVGSGMTPSDFILMEAEKNVGCIAPRSIIAVKDNLFFASNDGIYQISPDFRFTPITLPIKDDYQNTDNKDKTRLFFDVKSSEILCRFGTDMTVMYVYNIENQTWRTRKFTDNSPPAPSFFTIDDSLDVWAIRQYEPDSGGTGNQEQEQGNDQAPPGDNEGSGGNLNDDSGGSGDGSTGGGEPENVWARDHETLAKAETTPEDYWSAIIPDSSAETAGQPSALFQANVNGLTEGNETYLWVCPRDTETIAWGDKGNVTFRKFQIFQEATVNSHRGTEPPDGTSTLYLPVRNMNNNIDDLELGRTYYLWDTTTEDPQQYYKQNTPSIQVGRDWDANAVDDFETLVAIPVALDQVYRNVIGAGDEVGSYYMGGQNPDTSGGNDSGGNDSGGDDSGGDDSGGGDSGGNDQGGNDSGGGNDGGAGQGGEGGGKRPGDGDYNPGDNQGDDNSQQ